MIDELIQIENSIFQNIGLKISNIQEEKEAKEYFGYNFQIQNFKFKFRKSNITPKKTGQFVTLWQRDPNGKTMPFHALDDYDFYIIACKQENNSGIFLFPKLVLTEKRILSTKSVNGKRGFRVYTIWDSPKSNQAIKTKNWQIAYFIDFSENRDVIIEKYTSIIMFK